MTKQAWLCKAIPEEVWGKAWDPPPCPSSPLPAPCLGVSTSPSPLLFSRNSQLLHRTDKGGRLPAEGNTTRWARQRTEEGLSRPSLCLSLPQVMVLRTPVLTAPKVSSTVARGYLFTIPGSRASTQKRNRFEPQQTCLLTVRLCVGGGRGVWLVLRDGRFLYLGV